MTTAISELEVSPEEYLIRERQADYRHEFVAGRILAMSGATRRHNLISVNVASEISLDSPEEALHLALIDCPIPLAEIYDKVAFEADSPAS